MKKIYIIPRISCMLTQHEKPLASSGVTGSNGIGYGGVDNDGSKEADVKSEGNFNFQWE